jgi:head-tail adaptor
MPGAGQLNQLITILKGFDSSGVGETTTEYKDFYKCIPAKQEDVSGGETRRGQQVEASVKAVFVIPFLEGVSPHWRVRLINGTRNEPTFDIISVLDKDGMRTWLELHCGDVR